MSGLFCLNKEEVDYTEFIQKEDNEKYELKSKSKIYIHPISIGILSKNFRESYRKLSLNIQEKNFQFERINSKNRIYTFSNSVVTNNGIIVTKNKYYFNGGCCAGINIDKNQIFEYRKYLEKNTIKYKKVISIAEKWGEGVWHFPVESIVSLKNISDFSNFYLHISKKTKLCINWIKLLNIPITEDRIIDGNIFAEQLVIPEMAGCGNPRYDLTIWLKNRIYKNINLSPKKNKLILIKRNFRRIVNNHDELEKICKTFSEKLNLELYVHDDKNLPSLKQQMEIFNEAKLVIGPHGAGAVNLIASKPGIFFVEFLPISQNLINTCYIHLINYLDINYYGITHQVNRNLNLVIFNEVLEKLEPLL